MSTGKNQRRNTVRAKAAAPAVQDNAPGRTAPEKPQLPDPNAPPAPQPPQDDVMVYHMNFNLAGMQLLGKGLALLPHGEVAVLINAIQQEATLQEKMFAARMAARQAAQGATARAADGVMRAAQEAVAASRSEAAAKVTEK